jgi:hypothetical protein
MTRVHVLVLAFLLLTVVVHTALVGLVSLVSRRPRSRKDTSSGPRGGGPERPARTDRRVESDRAVRRRRDDVGHRGMAVLATCAGCGLPISLTRSRRRRPARDVTSVTVTPSSTPTNRNLT